jgi:hypothetical protein
LCVKYKSSDLIYVVRQAEQHYRLAYPASVALTSHFRITWLVDSNAIICFVVVEINETWDHVLIENLGKAAEQLVCFLRLMGICALTSFATVSIEPNLELLDAEAFTIRNEIKIGHQMMNCSGERWENFFDTQRARYNQVIKFKPTAKHYVNGKMIGAILSSLRRDCIERWHPILRSNADFHWVDAGDNGFCLITVKIAKDKSVEHQQLIKVINRFRSVFMEVWLNCPALLTYTSTPQPFTTELRDIDYFTKPKLTKSLFICEAFGKSWSDIRRANRRIEFIQQLAN